MSKKQKKALGFIPYANGKNNPKNTLQNTAVDTGAAVVGGLAGSFIGRFSALLGVGAIGASHYFGIPALTTLGAGMVTGITSVGGLSGVDGFDVKDGMERSKMFLKNLKNNVLPKKAEAEAVGYLPHRFPRFRPLKREILNDNHPRPRLSRDFLLRENSFGNHENETSNEGELAELGLELTGIYEEFNSDYLTGMTNAKANEYLQHSKDILSDMDEVSMEAGLSGLGEIITDIQEDIDNLEAASLNGLALVDDLQGVMDTVGGVAEYVLSGLISDDDDDDLDGLDDDDDDLDGLDDDDDDDLDGLDDDDDLDGLDDDDDDLDGLDDDDDDGDLDGFGDEDEDDINGFYNEF